MYQRDPSFLGAVATHAELFEAEELNDLLTAARVVLPREYRAMRAATAELRPPSSSGADSAAVSGVADSAVARGDVRREWLELLEQRLAEPADTIAALEAENARLKAELATFAKEGATAPRSDEL